MDRRTSIKLLGGAASAAMFSKLSLGTAAAARGRRPNIILIVVDDLRWDEFSAGGHPYLQTPNIDRLQVEGASFSRVIHATPLCSPNRACLLTGQYVARHGIYNNADRSLSSHLLPTFPQQLQRSGYATAHVGKWHMGNDPTPRPGFDYWVSFPGQGKINDPELFEDGRLRKTSGYVTDLLNDRALGFIRNQRGSQRPFFLCLAHKAVHPDAIQRSDGSLDTKFGSRYIAAARHQNRYQDKVFPRATSAKSVGGGTFASVMVERFLARKQSAANVREFGVMLEPGMTEQSIRDRAEMILAVDEGLGQILNELSESAALENTAIVFTSDNGFFFGEHGLSIERRLPYEESVRAPLLVRYPELAAAGSSVASLASSIDVAPTILQIGGAEVGRQVQGRSLLPLLSGRVGRATRRDSVLIENFSDDQPFPWLLDADYKAIRTDRHKFIHWIRHPEFNELYDLEADPREERNVILEPGNHALVAKLRTMLASLVQQSISL
ncbi:MAG: sulfatase-like hydrolase/transferase [Steroidobacteraceae bacterium]